MDNPTVNYGPEEAAMQAYLNQGEQRAFALGNRGPIRFTPDGNIHPDILEATGAAVSTCSRAFWTVTNSPPWRPISRTS